MVMKKYLSFILVCIFFISCQKAKRNLNPDKLVGGFKLLPSEETGIDFNNSINETKTFNHFFYSQIYNGAGIAIGDINNDGLPDVFFGGNQVSDRLYLNKGNFKFEDITKKSKAAKNSGWTWGVTMADVNADGYLDIYVSRNGNSLNLEDCRNQLYINNQDLTFTESAMKFGLADVGFSTQAVFFDMDNDGDLDMYQANQPPDQKMFLLHNISNSQIKFYTDKLYRNDNGRFIDISKQAGISTDLTYGLSVNATDFNNDGFVDLYVSNDYEEPDFMYYNNGDGTFKNVIHENLKHISRFCMGTDTGDINNDGLIDLITLDMSSDDHYRSKTNMGSMSTEEFNKVVSLGKHYQYMFNTLQVNTGNGHFYDVANMAGVGLSDWSWAGLLADLDNDGFKDVVISNGIKKDVRNNDYLTVVNNLDPNISSEEFFKISKLAPSIPLPNYIFRNKGNLEFQKVTNDWGFNNPGFSSGMAYGDLDNDGDLDIITNNMDAPASIYENEATGNSIQIEFEGYLSNTYGYGAKAIIQHNGKTQIANNFVSRGYLSSVQPGLFFGLGKDIQVEKVEIIWPDGKTQIINNVGANKTLTVKHTNATVSVTTKETNDPILTAVNPIETGILYKHQENEFDELKEEILLPHNVSQNGPFTAIADVNNDGLEDLFLGGAAGQSGVLYIQNNHAKFVKSRSQPWENDKTSEDLGCLFIDIDGDNDLDLYVASGGSEVKRGNSLLQDRIYINNGKGEFIKDLNSLPNIFESSQCIKASDIDNDGDLDIFVGIRLVPGQYGYPASSYFLINDNGTFKKAPIKIAPDLKNIGMVTDVAFTDIDKDGDEDLIVVGEWMEITLLKNNKGIFSNHSKEYGLEDTRGLWWSITAGDLDGDGDDDYIIGNLGKNNKFKASQEHPFKLYANDFDNNGTNDIVLAKFYKDDYVPVRGRECTSQQMPFVAEKFKDYHSFASSKLVDILPKEKVDEAFVYGINNFESIILINKDGKLIRKQLPIEAQISPIKSSLICDVNNDGYKDILIVGNHYGVEVETTRYDAGFGSVLIGDGKNNFEFMPPTQSGFYSPTDSRLVKTIKVNSKDLILVTNNNASLSIFRYNN